MHSRFDATALSDAEFRQRYGIPAIDNVLCRKRLLYLARLVRTKPAPLVQLLGSTYKGKRLPWWQLMLDDLALLRRSIARNMPPPDADFEPWVFVIRSEEWRGLVSQLVFHESVLDSSPQEAPPQAPCQQWSCDACSESFATEKALGRICGRNTRLRTRCTAFSALASAQYAELTSSAGQDAAPTSATDAVRNAATHS